MATIKTAIVTAIDAANPPIADKMNYLGEVRQIPIFVDASVALVNSGDVIELTKALPPKTKAVSIALNHDGAAGLATASTLAITAGGTVLTPTATIPTSADTDSAMLVYSLKDTEVSGKKIIATVGGADWVDTVDLYGYILVVSE